MVFEQKKDDSLKEKRNKEERRERKEAKERVERINKEIKKVCFIILLFKVNNLDSMNNYKGNYIIYINNIIIGFI